jgi:hypothetical protein
MKKYLFLIIAIGVLFTSCKKDRQPVEENLPQSMENLQVPADFDWKTTADYQFEVSSDLDGILSFSDDQGTTYHTAVLAAGSSYQVKLTLPTYLNKIRVKQMGRIIEADLASGLIKIDF